MKKKYTRSEIEITFINTKDVVTLSVATYSNEQGAEDGGTYSSIFGHTVA